MITIDDLVPGKTLTICNQGRAISPQPMTVTIHWVGPRDVHYIAQGETEIRDTTIERFLSIVNGTPYKPG